MRGWSHSSGLKARCIPGVRLIQVEPLSLILPILSFLRFLAFHRGDYLIWRWSLQLPYISTEQHSGVYLKSELSRWCHCCKPNLEETGRHARGPGSQSAAHDACPGGRAGVGARVAGRAGARLSSSVSLVRSSLGIVSLSYLHGEAAAASATGIPSVPCCGAGHRHRFLAVWLSRGLPECGRLVSKPGTLTPMRRPLDEKRSAHSGRALCGENGCKENRYFMNIHRSVNLHIAYTLFCILICP